MFGKWVLFWELFRAVKRIRIVNWMNKVDTGSFQIKISVVDAGS